MNRDRILIEVDELLTKTNNPNIRIFDATIMFYNGFPNKVLQSLFI